MSVVGVLRIADWAKHFENNRSRDRKKLDWVPFPNKHDGDGFSDLLDHANGMAHYGAWALIVQVASKCDKRGTLLRDGAKPYDARSLARVTRGSQKTFEEAIPRLLDIGWLEVVDVEHQEVTKKTAPECDEAALECPEEKGIEEKRREGAARGDPHPPAAHIPNETEFLNAFISDGIPEEYLRKQWLWFDGNNEWLDRRQRLKKWASIVRGRWVNDRAEWGKDRNGRHPKPAKGSYANPNI